MFFEVKENALLCREGNETVLLEPWGVCALRVRATKNARFTGEDHALEKPAERTCRIALTDEGATIENGKLRAFVSCRGWMEFYAGGRRVLKEFHRNFRGANDHSPSMKLEARSYKPAAGDDYDVTLRFEANPGEKLFGMGQYQQPNFDLKGCVLELAQRNSQVSVPFCLSNLGYGFLWNNPGVGSAAFGANETVWHARLTPELDFWITAGDTPREILKNYTAVTGRAPEFPENALGLWQSKLRYRTQEEVLEVAAEYHRRGIPLDVIVIDFFHWVRQGDWRFDPVYWPDPAAMVRQLRAYGTRCMVSVWPTVDKKSVHYAEMTERGLVVRTERGSVQCFDFQGDTVIYDAENPAAREYIWEKCKESYYSAGIDMFWLDEAEPEYSAYDFEHFRHYTGPALRVGCRYPRDHAMAFYEGMRREGQRDIVNLVRSAWVGSQKYAALVWSGDIPSTFAALRDQLSAGLHMGLAGIPWWTSDTGGFFGDVRAPGFNELLIRWFQFSAFCPVLRMHGDRGPHDIPRLSDLDYGGGFSETGRPNELWSYGEEVFSILKRTLELRLSLKPYIKSVFDEASRDGSPVIRPLFYEFPEDGRCWDIGDEYMFGPDYLVAPVLYEGVRERQVYLPRGTWRSLYGGAPLTGPVTLTAPAPLDAIPVYVREENDRK